MRSSTPRGCGSKAGITSLPPGGFSAVPAIIILILLFRPGNRRRNLFVPAVNTRNPVGWKAAPVPAVVYGAATAEEVPGELLETVVCGVCLVIFFALAV